MADFIIIAILILLVGWACSFIWKAKKNGVKCIGCSNSGCPSCKGCGASDESKDN